jgi:hypothetical protein
VQAAGEQDEIDIYGTFSTDVAVQKGIAPFDPDKVNATAGAGTL